MAVRKLRNGKWVADVVVGVKADGSPDRRTRRFALKKDAQTQEALWKTEKTAKKGDAILSGRIPFRDFVEAIYWPQKKHLRANTVRNYKRDLKLRLLPAFGGMAIEEIGRMQVQRMIDSCETRKQATNARETLSSILSLAADMGLVAKNPASSKFNYPKRPPQAPDAFGVWLSTFDEHKKVLEHVRGEHRGESVERIVVLGLCCGLRKGEILGLDWERVDLERREIRIVQTYVIGDTSFLAEPKTEKSKRTVPLPLWALNRMKEWDVTPYCSPDLEGKPVHPVVVGKYGRRLSPNGAEKQVRKLREERFSDGTPMPGITMMSCRHSFATACIRAGIEVSSVSKWLGHEQISTTYNRYVKPLLSDLHGDVSTIDSIIGG